MSENNEGFKVMIAAILVIAGIYYAFKGMWTAVIGNVVSIPIIWWLLSRKKKEKE